MELKLPLEVADGYINNSQRIRVMTEYWVNNSIFCPNCGNSLNNFENNKPVADYYCKKCLEEYELKSKQGEMGKKIVDGAYFTMIERLKSNNNPNFFFLAYDRVTLEVVNFLTIPKYFFIPDIVEKRNSLSSTAKRAGWIGCNIVLNNIPEFGKIFYIQNGIAINKNEVLNKWRKTEFVRHTHDFEAKGWMLDILVCVEKISRKEFILEDVYNFESHLQSKHPSNNNIRAKIRQQLQFLRDRDVIEFVGHGKYKMIN
jgi:type II restriction enzyme